MLFRSYTFNIFSNYISDLGSTKYTPLPIIFDLNAIITGILCLIVFYHSNNVLHQVIRPKLTPSNQWVLKSMNFSKYLLILGPIGLAGIGIFSEDRNFFELHFIFAVIAFLGFTFGSIAMAITSLAVDTFIPAKMAKSMILAPLTLLIFYLTNLALPIPFVSMIFFEWCIFLCTFWWVLPNGFLLLRYLEINKPAITPFSIQAFYMPFPTQIS